MIPRVRNNLKRDGFFEERPHSEAKAFPFLVARITLISYHLLNRLVMKFTIFDNVIIKLTTTLA